MKRMMTLALLATGAGLAAGTACADPGFAIGGGVGTTGGKIEAEVSVTPHIVLRGGYNYFKYDVDNGYEDIDYTGDLDLTTWGAFVDLHPFGGAFMLTGGAYIGDKGLALTASPSSTYEIDGQTFTAAEVGTLHLDANMESTAPFVGLGWDTTFSGDGPWGFRFVAGAMFTGSPSVDLYTVGGTRTPTQDAALQQAIADEEVNLQDDVNDFEVYPVVEAGLTFRF
jgi:hypothetical protein